MITRGGLGFALFEAKDLRMFRKIQYFGKEIAISVPKGDHIFEFLVEAEDQIGIFERIVEVFSCHQANIISVSASLEEDEQKFAINLFADFSKANCTVDNLLEELKRLRFVTKAYSADMRGKMFDRFLFPIRMMKGSRVLLMQVEPLLSIERHLVESLGSAGSAIMFEEGKSYAQEVFNQYVSAFSDASWEAFLENVKDGLRVTVGDLRFQWILRRF